MTSQRPCLLKVFNVFSRIFDSVKEEAASKGKTENEKQQETAINDEGEEDPVGHAIRQFVFNLLLVGDHADDLVAVEDLFGRQAL